MYILRFDGLLREISSTPHSQAGFMCYGWIICQDGRVIARGHGVFAHDCEATSSAAEYLGLIEGLEALLDLGIRDQPVQVVGDAKSIIEQLQGVSGVNSLRTRQLYRRARKLARNFTDLTWSWAPRRHNRDADLLTRRAMRQICSSLTRFQEAVDAIDLHKQSAHPSGQFLPVIDLRVYQPQLSW